MLKCFAKRFKTNTLCIVIMPVILHTKSGCPWCDRAKEFFREHSIPYEEVYYDTSNPTEYEEKKTKLLEITKHYTFPQIFVGEVFVGGYSELLNAFSTLRLHELLKPLGIELDVEF